MRIFPLAVAALLVTGAAACSSSSNSSTPPPTEAPTTTTAPSGGTAGGTVHDLRALAGNRWSTGTLTLAVGDSVRVTDADTDVPHNFTVSGVGHSKTMNGGDVFTLVFPKAGTFDFVCTFHQSQGMVGTVTVR